MTDPVPPIPEAAVQAGEHRLDLALIKVAYSHDSECSPALRHAARAALGLAACEPRQDCKACENVDGAAMSGYRTIPDAAVEAGVAEVERITAAPDLEAERVGGEMPEGFVVRAVLTAALPHLVTDEMVERAVGGYREVAGRCSRQATRAALEAALGIAA